MNVFIPVASELLRNFVTFSDVEIIGTIHKRDNNAERKRHLEMNIHFI